MTDTLPDDELRARVQDRLDHEQRWAILCRESDVRCTDCDLRYAERQEYGCQWEGRGHTYDEAELATARRPQPDDTDGDLRALLDRLAHAEARTAEAVEEALTEAADALEGTLGTTPAPPRNLWEFRCWLRDRAAQVRAARGATEGRGGA